MTAIGTLSKEGGSSSSGSAAWRLAAILVFLGIPLVAAGLVVSAVMAGLDASAVAEHADDMARTIVHQLDRRPANARKPMDTTPLYLTSATAGLARAELQALVGRLVEAGGGRVLEAQTSDAAETDALGHVAIDISFDATNAGLLDILYATETGLPLLTVPRLEARPGTAGDGQTGADPLLHVSMTVQGTWKVAAP